MKRRRDPAPEGLRLVLVYNLLKPHSGPVPRAPDYNAKMHAMLQEAVSGWERGYGDGSSYMPRLLALPLIGNRGAGPYSNKPGKVPGEERDTWVLDALRACPSLQHLEQSASTQHQQVPPLLEVHVVVFRHTVTGSPDSDVQFGGNEDSHGYFDIKGVDIESETVEEERTELSTWIFPDGTKIEPQLDWHQKRAGNLPPPTPDIDLDYDLLGDEPLFDDDIHETTEPEEKDYEEDDTGRWSYATGDNGGKLIFTYLRAVAVMWPANRYLEGGCRRFRTTPRAQAVRVTRGAPMAETGGSSRGHDAGCCGGSFPRQKRWFLLFPRAPVSRRNHQRRPAADAHSRVHRF